MIKNNTDYLNNILQKLDTIRNSEFLYNNYKPIEVEIKKKVKKESKINKNI